MRTLKYLNDALYLLQIFTVFDLVVFIIILRLILAALEELEMNMSEVDTDEETEP